MRGRNSLGAKRKVEKHDHNDDVSVGEAERIGI